MPPSSRFRITFSKTAAMRYTGHLDVNRTWERTLRRARLPLTYSSGFRPHPRIVLGAALPLGLTSECELIEFWLDGSMAPDDILARLRLAAPPGIEPHEVREVSLQAPALPTLVVSAEYDALVRGVSRESLKAAAERLLQASSLPRERRGKAYDLRPLIEHLHVVPGGDHATLRMRLAVREGATGRPEEVLEALGVEPRYAAVHRRRLVIAHPADAAPSPGRSSK